MDRLRASVLTISPVVRSAVPWLLSAFRSVMFSVARDLWGSHHSRKVHPSECNYGALHHLSGVTLLIGWNAVARWRLAGVP